MALDIVYVGWFALALVGVSVTCLIDWIYRRLAIRAQRKEQAAR